MSLREKATKGIFWSMTQKWGRAAITALTFVVLSRLLGPDAFGLVTLASVFIDFVEIFLDQGFSAAIIQRPQVDRKHLDTAFWISILTGGLLTVGNIAASGFIATFFHEPRLGPVLSWLSLAYIVNALSTTQLAILQRRLAFKSLAARSLAAAAVGGVVGIGMAFAGFGVWSLVGQNLAKSIAAAVILWSSSDWRPGFNVSVERYKELFGFGINIVGNNLLNVTIRHADDFLIGYFLGPTMLGLYTVGYQLLLIIIRLVTEVTNTVAFPAFSRLQHEPERMRRAFYKVTQYTSVLSFPVFIGLALVSPEIVPAVFGAKWAQSIPVMQVLSIIGILQSVLFFNGSVLRASGKPNWEFAIMGLNALCSIIGFLVAVRWGIVAVAASFVITGYLIAPVSYMAVRKQIQIDFRTYLGQYVPPLVASFGMVAVVMGLKYLFKDQSWNAYVELIIYVLAGGLTYLGIIGMTARKLFWQMTELVRLGLPQGRFGKLSSSSEESILK
jgi:O-antigen/teichoic acid export membrane protein